MDWSTQIEQKKPWASLLVPKALQISRNIDANVMYGNQNKLVTAFDFYRTLRGLIAPETRTTTVPSWSFDLMSSLVPGNRTCYDARIPRAYCALENEPAVEEGGHLDFLDEPGPQICQEDQEPPKGKSRLGCPRPYGGATGLV